ncbi:hypothetical protein C7212DRAFT_364808 [Tuber magnatum]|uniref:Uncharacterized protein n=1 Tax=Tuber magnatum TaxID=42249 RepID=A0A317SPJ7_9PEZI|nr:hypothetical protein C7212DRAFT_364808 [Tuber magnatum]
MAPTNIPQDARRNDEDPENNEDRRSESPKVPVRGRGAWKPTPKPLLPSQVMRLKLEVPREPGIMRFGVPYFGRRSGGEEGDEEGDGVGGFSSSEPKTEVEVPGRKETLRASIETKAQKEVMLAEKATQNLAEAWDLGHPKNTEETEGVQGPKDLGEPEKPEVLTEQKAKVEARKVEEQAVKKLRSKSERIPECKRDKIYESPTAERKPFQMKKQSNLPDRMQPSTIRVRELSEGPRSPTISSRLKWVTRPSSPATPEKKRPTTPLSTLSRSMSVISLNSGRSTPTGRFSSPLSESPFRRPSSAPGLEHRANSPLSQGSNSRRRIPEPPILVVPQGHILCLENAVEGNPEGAAEDTFPPLLPDVATKPEVGMTG